MKNVHRFVLYAVMAAGAATMVVPFLWMASTSLKAPTDVFTMPPTWIPPTLHPENYWPLVVTHPMDLKTLPIGLAAFEGQCGNDWTLLMAASVMATVPVIIVFVMKHFVEGIKMSGFGGT